MTSRIFVLITLVSTLGGGCVYDRVAYPPRNTPDRGETIIPTSYPSRPQKLSTKPEWRRLNEVEGRNESVDTKRKQMQPEEAPPLALKVEGKTGMVTLPGAPTKLIDVRGLPPGSTARDPDSGILFTVP